MQRQRGGADLAARAGRAPRLVTLLRRPPQPVDTILPQTILCACGGDPHPVHWQHRGARDTER